MPAAPPRFGIFDWLDESGRDLAQTYEERLRMLEVADRAGFYAYHLAEHHATELSTVPSPNLFLSAVAQRTTRLRFGALSYVIPTYEPMRLLEEICMLDQLSGGRLELGLSRGSTGEHIENNPAKARAVFHEALEVILRGLSTGEIDYHGEFFAMDGAFTRLRPRQTPYPPLWYPTSNLESIDWVAANGISTAFSIRLAPSFEHVCAMVARYWSTWQAHAADTSRLNAHVAQPICALSVHIHVADTDEQARSQARPAYEQFVHNYTYRFVRRGQADRYEARPSFASALERGHIVVGSPATVRGQLDALLAASGANYVMGTFAFGDLPLQQLLGSVELFAREVMPAAAAVAR
jgi:alkanesulfonate monooxygenase SsuD/methylene tetrahydromethanopterin reductase-like flavin-dependent oxidoreductase (luciferase family)